jgi:hypothetical protein
MAMTNFRDLSTTNQDVAAGFQFEFFCEITGETWRSQFRPYRRGQLTGWISRFTFLFTDLHSVGRATGYMADSGARNAKAAALAEAQEIAAQRFHQCGGCEKWVCLAAWDDRSGQCTQCAAKSGSRRGGGGSSAYGHEEESSSSSGGAACPNCQTPSEGGRFCHECGFDMASTFKSCPGCGTTLPRQARFCTDCGHGF